MYVCIHVCAHIYIYMYRYMYTQRPHTHTNYIPRREDATWHRLNSINTKKMNAWIDESNCECDVPEMISTEYNIIFLPVPNNVVNGSS